MYWLGIAGAKLFYLSGIRNGKYLKREVLNLARFISIMKLRPLSWRSSHPYLLTDRFEVTSPITFISSSASSKRPFQALEGLFLKHMCCAASEPLSSAFDLAKLRLCKWMTNLNLISGML